jgi:hypothetical protein
MRLGECSAESLAQIYLSFGEGQTFRSDKKLAQGAKLVRSLNRSTFSKWNSFALTQPFTTFT